MQCSWALEFTPDITFLFLCMQSVLLTGLEVDWVDVQQCCDKSQHQACVKAVQTEPSKGNLPRVKPGFGLSIMMDQRYFLWTAYIEYTYKLLLVLGIRHFKIHAT